MQVLSVIVPYSRATSNFYFTCKALRVWLSNNAFPIRTDKGGLSLENYSFYKMLNYFELDRWMRWEMSRATREGEHEYLQLLLDSGGDIEAPDCDGDTFLNEAACFGEIECLKVLLENKAELETNKCRGSSAVTWAARYSNAECLKMLLEHKADPDTDLIVAITASEGRVDCLKLLLEYGAQVEPRLRKEYPQYAELWNSTL